METSLTMFNIWYTVAGIYSLYGSTVPSWQQPSFEVTYDVNINASLPLQVGQVVNLTCTAHNNMDTATMEWMRVAGTNEARQSRGSSPLSMIWTVTAADHGVEFYCGSSFFDTVNGRIENYYSKSASIPIQVEGVSSGAFVINPNERVRVEVDPVATSYNVHDIVKYVCEVENMSFPPVEMRQRKGNVEYQLYFGYHTSYRWMEMNVTAADDGTEIYCIAWRTDSNWNSYLVNGEPYTLNINH